MKIDLKQTLSTVVSSLIEKKITKKIKWWLKERLIC